MAKAESRVKQESWVAQRKAIEDEGYAFLKKYPELFPDPISQGNFMTDLMYKDAGRTATMEQKMPEFFQRYLSPSTPDNVKKGLGEMFRLYEKSKLVAAQASPGWANFAMNQQANQQATSLVNDSWAELTQMKGGIAPTDVEFGNFIRTKAARLGVPIQALLLAARSAPDSVKKTNWIDALLAPGGGASQTPQTPQTPKPPAPPQAYAPPQSRGEVLNKNMQELSGFIERILGTR
jgi:hypothetical protein